ncbi:MAG: toxin TcdB middle/N-terminal domain-containing protein, partial [Steroidobacteraceae bacterium]
MTGLSEITRCAATWAQDSNPAGVTLTSSDKLCLDGKRLRTVTGPTPYCTGGTLYETEIADFSLVTACGTAGNGPAYFVVKGKDGLLYEYGNTTDSRVMPCSPSCATPYAWALNKIRDRQGNNLMVTYTQTSGSYMPSAIQYTQTPASNGTTYPDTLSFAYSTRAPSDLLDKYIAGLKIQQTKQLSSVTVSASTTSVREYDLYYTASPTTFRNVLTSVQECGFNPAPTKDCLTPTTIAYQYGTSGIASPTISAGTTGTVSGLLNADMDGDGHDDLIYKVISGTTAHWWVKFGTASGLGTAVDTTLVTGWLDTVLLDDFLGEGKNSLLAAQGTVWYAVRWNGTAFLSTPTGIGVPNAGDVTNGKCATADVNGDAKPDLVCVHTADSQPYIRMNTSTTSVSFGAETVIPTSPTQILSVGGNNAPGSNVRHLDFNGDGHGDLLMRFSTTAGGGNFEYGMLLSTGSTSAPGLSLYTNVGLGMNNSVTLNFNNDACTDIASGNNLIISPCNGTAGGIIPFTGSPLGTPMLAADWDGDGRTDLLVDSGGSFVVYLSQGDSLSAPISTGITVGIGQYLVLDFDGDGLDDLAHVDSTTYAVTYGAHHGVATPSDRLSNVTDGYGISVTPTYRSIARDIYAKYSDGVFPDIDYKAPLYVVYQFTASAGNGQNYTQSFQYFGARMNLQGRGFDGFWAQEVFDSRDGTYDLHYFQRTFPYTGLLYFDDLYQHDQVHLIHHNVNNFAASTLDGTANNQRYFPYVIKYTEQDREVDATASLITQVVTDFVYDAYGNASTVTRTSTDEDASSPWSLQTWVTKTVKSISNDTTNWCLGHPAQTTVTNTVPGTPAVTRTTAATVDYVNCREISIVDEPLSGSLKVTRNYSYASVACGNVSQVDVIGLNPGGSAMTTRTTKFGYGALCEVPETVTNAQTEQTLLTYNYTYGLPASRKDPNTLQTLWTYDDFGRLSKETRPDGTYTTLTVVACNAGNSYCSVPDLRSAIARVDLASNGSAMHAANLYFDGLDRQRYDEEQNMTGALTYRSITDYDALGNTQYQYGPFFPTGTEIYHQYTRDLLGRVTLDQFYRFVTGLDRQIQYTYAGRQVQVKDARTNVTTKFLNVWGQLGQVVDPSPGGTTKYTYEPFGKLASLTDAASNVSSWTYDLRGHLTGSSDPDRGIRAYQPDSLGEMIQIRYANTVAPAWTQTMAYDLLGRLTSRAEAEGTSTWVWGSSAISRNIDKLACVNAFADTSCTSTPLGYREAYTYDALGRPSVASYSADTGYQVSYVYNPASGRLDNMTYPASLGATPLRLQFTYTYGTLSKISDFNTPTTLYWQMNAQDAWRQPTDEQLGNGVHVLSGTDDLTGHLKSIASGTNGTVYNNQQNITYQWDPNENLTDRIDANQASLDEHFVYDPLNRLSYSTLTGVTGHTLDVGLDATGNV